MPGAHGSVLATATRPWPLLATSGDVLGSDPCQVLRSLPCRHPDPKLSQVTGMGAIPRSRSGHPLWHLWIDILDLTPAQPRLACVQKEPASPLLKQRLSSSPPRTVARCCRESRNQNRRGERRLLSWVACGVLPCGCAENFHVAGPRASSLSGAIVPPRG